MFKIAYDFNGSSNQANYTLTSNQYGNTLESWSFWLYPDSVNQYKRPIHVGGTGSNRDRSFEMDDGWGFVFNFNFSTSGGAWSVSKPSTGAWVHYAVTFDGSSTSNDPIIYKDAVSQTVTERVAPSGTLRSSRTDLYIGTEAGTGQYWDGGIAQVAKFNKILSQDEITDLSTNRYSPLHHYGDGLVLLIEFKEDTKEYFTQNAGTGTAPTKIADPYSWIYPDFSAGKRFLVQGSV